ncbi:MAG: methyltransferase domain-containing protein [Anaerolineales bacterium]|nr:methyltransferase domain-containing protein [Anaerolineales bacterium]
MKKQQENFSNWVPGKMIIIPGILGLICLALGFIHWGFWIPAILFLLISGYFIIAWIIFSSRFGNLQDKIQELVVSHIDWKGNGKVLDIGCGNAPLTIKLAKKYPEAEIIGMDYWGKNWDYSMQFCTANAEIAGVEKQISFKQGSASRLPFEDASFDLVVSNLVFHEVQDVKDKRVSIQEALRVLKPGGVFVFQDLFLLTPYYGTPEALLNTIRQWGVSEVEFIRTCNEPFIPKLVKLPFMVGTLAIIRGVK